MATLAVTGRIAPRSRPAAMYVGGAVVEPTRTPIALTPLGVAVRELCDAIIRGDVEPCPVCDHYACDCDEWHEIMNADPHGDLSAAQSLAIPY